MTGLIAGSFNTAVTLTGDVGAPGPFTVAASAGVGLLGYGVSSMLFVLSLRHLGTARTGAYFSLAPFVGASLAIPILGEGVPPQFPYRRCFNGCRSMAVSYRVSPT